MNYVSENVYEKMGLFLVAMELIYVTVYFQVAERAGQAVAALQKPGHGLQRQNGAAAGPGDGHDHHQGLRPGLQGHLTQAGKFTNRVTCGSMVA